jgi:hypothetical protein
MNTPWGPSQGIEKVSEGILCVTTEGHGGYKVHPNVNHLVPAKWRLGGKFEGWYEEDCGWAPLALTFPRFFPGMQAEAEAMIPHWESWVRRLSR